MLKASCFVSEVQVILGGGLDSTKTFQFIYCFMVGFDQNSWGKPVYRLMVSAWIVIGLAWMSSVIALTQDHMGEDMSYNLI